MIKTHFFFNFQEAKMHTKESKRREVEVLFNLEHKEYNKNEEAKLLPIKMTFCSLKITRIGAQGNIVESAINGGLNFLGFDEPKFQSNLQKKLQINPISPIVLLRRVIRFLPVAERDQVLALNHRAQIRRVLSGLKKRVEIDGGESLAAVERACLDYVVVNPDPLVGVANRHVEGEIVQERVVGGGEIELGEGGVVDVEFDGVWSENEPEDERDDAGEDEERAEDLEEAAADAVEETAAAAAEWVAAAA